MRSPPRSPRPSARQSAPRCQPTQPGLAREAATREDCCGRERGPGDVEGGREGGRGRGRESLFGPLALQICRPGRMYYRSVDTCVSRRRVCESAALDARTAGGGWPLSVSSASHVPALFGVCVFDLVPYTYRIHHTRGANARQLTTHITRFYLSTLQRRADVRCELLLQAQPLGAQHAAQLVRLQLRGRLHSNRRQGRGK